MSHCVIASEHQGGLASGPDKDLGAKYRSSHGSELDTGETRESVRWLLEGPGGPSWLLERQWCLGVDYC